MAEVTPAALTIAGLTKAFGGQRALREVDFQVRSGEIHALLGANGAGKSTLIKILAGVHHADAGTIRVGGAALPGHHRRADAVAHGLAFVHQDLGLIDDLSVAENVALEVGYATRGRLIAFRATERRAASVLAQLGCLVDPRRPVGELAQDEKVMVAVARAFAQQARVIVLDEVSSSLPAPEARRLGEALKAARASGVAFVYVTHRLGEVFDLADRLTVLRDGRRVLCTDVATTGHATVVEAIVGHPVIQGEPIVRTRSRSRRPGDERLRVRGLLGPGLADPVDLDVAAGEIVAVCGLIGCGARELAAMLGGATAPAQGEATLDGRPLPLGRPHRLARAGCAYVPGDRQAEGAIFDLSVRENLFAARRGAGPDDRFVRRPRRERAAARRLTKRFAVRPVDSSERPLGTLSGGNQQKVVVGRALRTPLALLVLDDPTAGVDIGARAELHRLLAAAAEDGMAVVMASTDFDEVAEVADRAIVLGHGRVEARASGRDLTAQHLARAAYGAPASPDLRPAGATA
jgi:ribose transport system ATP-binding protein